MHCHRNMVLDPVTLGQLAAQRLLHCILSSEGALEPTRDFIMTPRLVPGACCRNIEAG